MSAIHNLISLPRGILMIEIKFPHIFILFILTAIMNFKASAAEVREPGCQVFFRKIHASFIKHRPTSNPKLIAAHLYNRFPTLHGRWDYLQPFEALEYSPNSEETARVTGWRDFSTKDADIRLGFEVRYNLKDYSDNITVKIKLFSDNTTIKIKNHAFKEQVERITQVRNLKLVNAKTIKSGNGVIIQFEVNANQGIYKFFESLWIIETDLSYQTPRTLGKFYDAFIVSH